MAGLKAFILFLICAWLFYAALGTLNKQEIVQTNQPQQAIQMQK